MNYDYNDVRFERLSLKFQGEIKRGEQDKGWTYQVL